MSIKQLRGMVLAAWIGGSITAMSVVADDSVVDAPATVVSCPEEDSCTADYHDGAWHIEQVDE